MLIQDLPDVKLLCVEAAKMAVPVGDLSYLRPTILAAGSDLALTILTAKAPVCLEGAAIESALSSFLWVLHVRACTVSKWHPASLGTSPKAAVSVTCYAASGQWEMILSVESGRLPSPLAFREVFEVHALSEWRFHGAPEHIEVAGEADWPNRIYRQQPQLPPDSIEALETRIAHIQTWLGELESGRDMSISFSPIVAFDFAQHSAASNLESLSGLAEGMTNIEAVFSDYAEAAPELRKAHCEKLIIRLSSKLPNAAARQLTQLMDLPVAEIVRLLGKSSDLPEAAGLAYWAASFDHDTEGLSFGQLAKSFKIPSQVFEQRLALTPLTVSRACPICAGDAQYELHRCAVGTELLSFSMTCAACGHEESRHRDKTWTTGPLTCSCQACLQRRKKVSSQDLPQVVIALEDAFRATAGLATKSVHKVVRQIDTVGPDWESGYLSPEKNLAGPSEWDNKHMVLLELVSSTDVAPVHSFKGDIKLGALYGGTLEEVVQTVSSLGPSRVHYLEKSVRDQDDPDECFSYLPDCIQLLAEGDSFDAAELLSKWTKALKNSGLLCTERSKFEPLVIKPYAWLECNFAVKRNLELAMPGDLVVSREVPQAEALLLSVVDAIGEACEDAGYAETVMAKGYTVAAEHGHQVLEQAKSIRAPKVQAVLRLLADGQLVTVADLRGARDVLKRDAGASALFFAALIWNYSFKGRGEAKSPLGSAKLAVFSGKTLEIAHERYSLITPVVCNGCSSKTASLTFSGRSGLEAWRAECADCGHWAESRQGSYRYRENYCSCQHCANSASVALKGRSTASLLSELISHCVVETHVLSSQKAGALIQEQTDICELVNDLRYDAERADLVKQNAALAGWKVLRFNTSAGLLRHILPGYSFNMPSMVDLALLSENHSPTMSQTVFQSLRRTLRQCYVRYGQTHMRFQLPLCLTLPLTIKEPKGRKRSARQGQM